MIEVGGLWRCLGFLGDKHELCLVSVQFKHVGISLGFDIAYT